MLRIVTDRIASELRSAFDADNAGADEIATIAHIHLRYQGTDSTFAVPLAPLAEMEAAFTAAHRQRFGFATPGRAIVVEFVAVEAIAAGAQIVDAAGGDARTGGKPEPVDTVDIWTGGRGHTAHVFARAALRPGDRIEGPALITEEIATTVVEPGWTAEVSPLEHLVLRRTGRHEARADQNLETADPVLVELFNNLIFMNVANQMGAVLQNTSTSVNIRERLDFSCAVFDAGGNLIANAPHVPVHLGAMGESVRAVMRSRGASLKARRCGRAQ